jgi:hypothetical protein
MDEVEKWSRPQLLPRVPRVASKAGFTHLTYPPLPKPSNSEESSKNRSSSVPLAGRALSIASSVPGALTASSMVAIFIGLLELEPKVK